MRIALVTAWYWPKFGGVESVVSTLARALKERGHTVTIHTTHLRGEESRRVDPHDIHIHEHSNFFGFGFYPRLRGQYDAVNLHGTERLLIWLVPFLCRKVILTPHNGFGRAGKELIGQRFARTKQNLDRCSAPFILNKYATIVCLHATERDRLSALGIKEPKLAVIPNPVSMDIVSRSNEPSRDAESPYFVSVGRLSPEKGIEMLIDVAAQGGFELRLLGTGSEDYVQFLRNRVDELHANVSFLGFLDGQDKVSQVSRAAALLVGSSYEGQSLAILEAMELKTPVCAVPEASLGLIRDGITGYHYDRRKAGDLLATVRRILDKPSDALQIAETASQEIGSKHRPDLIAAQYEEIYERQGVDRWKY